MNNSLVKNILCVLIFVFCLQLVVGSQVCAQENTNPSNIFKDFIANEGVGAPQNYFWEEDDYLKVRKIFWMRRVSRSALKISPCTVPDDAFYGTHNFFDGYSDMWGWSMINMEDAWELSTGEGVIVAVLDSGIDTSHSDINSNIWRNNAEIYGSFGVDDDGNGYIDDTSGWDFCDLDNVVDDTFGHGTMVAGVVGAEYNNGDGIIGVAYDSKIMSVKIFDEEGATGRGVSDGIRYAVDMGAKVLNCSFVNQYNAEVISAFQYAIDNGCIIVCGSGNDGALVSAYPAIMDNTITVGSVDPDGFMSDFSNYGEHLDVVAPGKNILTLGSLDVKPYRGAYVVADGTSLSTPYVAGLAALMISQDPAISFDGILRRLKYSSIDLGDSGRDDLYGYGRIDAFKALSNDWYDLGVIKTWWLADPDETGAIRYDL